MKVEELILKEETLQAALKRLFKSGGSLQSILGKAAYPAAQLLRAKQTDKIFYMKPESPMTSRLVKSVAGSSAYDTDKDDDGNEMKIVRMPGGAKILVVGQGDQIMLITTDHDHDMLVEAEKEIPIYSKKKKEQEEIDPKVVKKIQKKAKPI